MSANRIASRYAKSLMELAQERHKLDLVLEDIIAFREALNNRDLFLMIKSPIIHADKKEQILTLIFEEHLDPLTMMFIKLIVRKRREVYLPEMSDEFVKQYRFLNQISTVALTTAIPASDELIQRIRSILEESNQVFENIELVEKVDPSIIGGFILEVEDKLYDASARHKLDSLKKEFSTNVYSR